jgi:hypothetical protein
LLVVCLCSYFLRALDPQGGTSVPLLCWAMWGHHHFGLPHPWRILYPHWCCSPFLDQRGGFTAEVFSHSLRLSSALFPLRSTVSSFIFGPHFVLFLLVPSV